MIYLVELLVGDALTAALSILLSLVNVNGARFSKLDKDSKKGISSGVQALEI